MTQEEKNLLFKDLCARLPYGVIIQHPELFCQSKMVVEKLTGIDNEHINDDGLPIEVVKPYLRPLSNMTEEEKVEYCDLQDKFLLSSQYPVSDGYVLFDWLNAHHFDYRGLIEKDLAIEAPENMYNDKNNKHGKRTYTTGKDSF